MDRVTHEKMYVCTTIKNHNNKWECNRLCKYLIMLHSKWYVENYTNLHSLHWHTCNV